jgi:hypothetical protein
MRTLPGVLTDQKYLGLLQLGMAGLLLKLSVACFIMALGNSICKLTSTMTVPRGAFTTGCVKNVKGKIMHNNGLATRVADSGEEVLCGVCGSRMNVKKVFGPMSWASAMAKHHVEHDLFTCPNIDAGWHQQALALLTEIENTPSRTFAEMLDKEYRKVVRLREKTKESWKKF